MGLFKKGGKFMKNNFLSRVILDVLLLLLILGATVQAGPLDIFDKLMPQPVYSIADGLEVEKMSQIGDLVTDMTEMKDYTVKIESRTANNIKLLLAALGNTKLIEKASENPSSITLDDILQWREDCILLTERIFGDKFGKMVKPDIEPRPTSKERENGEEKSKAYGRPKNEKELEEKTQKTNYVNSYMYNNYMNGREAIGETDRPPIPNSTVEFITDQQHQLAEINNGITQSKDKGSISAYLQTTNQLLLQQNQILLKVLQGIQDLNTQQYIQNSSETHERIYEDYIRLKHEQGLL